MVRLPSTFASPIVGEAVRDDGVAIVVAQTSNATASPLGCLSCGLAGVTAESDAAAAPAVAIRQGLPKWLGVAVVIGLAWWLLGRR